MDALVDGPEGATVPQPEVGLLVVALTVVRKRSGSACTLMSLAAGVFVLATLLSPLAYMGSARFGEAQGAEDVIKINAMLTVAFTIVRAGGWALLIAGIVRLAAPGERSSA